MILFEIHQRFKGHFLNELRAFHLTLETNSEAYSEPCQTFKMEFFAKIVNGF